MHCLTRGGALLRAAGRGRLAAFRAATPALDRHGTRILPQGIRTEAFDRNPVFLWGHDGYARAGAPPDPEAVIGRVLRHRAGPRAFDVEVEFAPAEANPRAEQALKLVRAGFLGAVSIGFLPLRSHEERLPDGRSALVFDSVELLEVSLVPVPSNPEALALVRAMAAAGQAPLADPPGQPPPAPAAALRAAFRRTRAAGALRAALRTVTEE